LSPFEARPSLAKPRQQLARGSAHPLALAAWGLDTASVELATVRGAIDVLTAMAIRHESSIQTVGVSRVSRSGPRRARGRARPRSGPIGTKFVHDGLRRAGAAER
jgi:hypothetical protein